MKAKRISLIIITLSVVTVIIFGVTTAFAVDNKEHIDELCRKNCVASEIVYATIESGYKINVDDYIESLGDYADLAGTDEEVDITEAMSEILQCSLDEAISIVDKSDNMQNNNN